MQAQLEAAFPPERRAALDRILQRARAEAGYVLTTVGTGAQITLKRATAVSLALENSAAPPATGLSAERVERVIENVLQSGFSALYPGFEESMPLTAAMTEAQLWKVIRPIIESSPREQGILRTRKWNPSIVAEFLVYNNTLEDASDSQIGSIIRRHLDSKTPLATFELVDTSHQSPDRKTPAWLPPLAFLFCCAILVNGLMMHSTVQAFFGLIFTIGFGVMLVKQLLEYRLLRKVLADKKAAPPAPIATVQQPPPVHLQPLAPPKCTFLHAMSLPPTPWNLDAMTDTVNALGQPPLRILYLWVFAAQADQGGFETEGWPQLGPVHLLLNATALNVGQLMGPLDKLLVSDTANLDRTIGEYNDHPNTYDRPMLFIDGSTSKLHYQGYPIHTLVCNDAVWKPAVHQLAARCDLAVVNLTGYNPQHPGLEYEIHHLFSGGPPSNFVFLYERTTDADAVVTSVLTIWSQLETPPALLPRLIFMRIPSSQDVGYAMQFGKATKGTGWLAKTMMAGEGDYIPIAARIVSYLTQPQSN